MGSKRVAHVTVFVSTSRKWRHVVRRNYNYPKVLIADIASIVAEFVSVVADSADRTYQHQEHQEHRHHYHRNVTERR